ncbi:MAG: hypothetical protein EOP84_26755 [Verrucomicrobiaceae bacterium]|nr:MAG: hypothetical protein EOP84_26755 [Verrucomicrobiaceae bacterium]
MKSLFFTILHGAALLASGVQAEEISGLERAIRELPAKFVADIPLEDRALLLRSLLAGSGDERLDLKKGFLNWYSDSPEAPRSSSMLYMQEYRKADGGVVVLTHMPKPYADGSTPRANQTFVFEQRKDQWTDITSEVLPKGIDLTNHFQPRWGSSVVEVSPYVHTKRNDGRGFAWTIGPRVAELHWNGRVLTMGKRGKDSASAEEQTR